MTNVTEFSPTDIETYSSALLRAAEWVSAGDLAAAQSSLNPIAGAIWQGKLSSRKAASAEASEMRSRTSQNAVRAQVFVRDRNLCTACGGKTIPRNILVAMHDLFPEEIPYHPNYKRSFTHPAFWFLAPEADHVMPHSQGGAFTLENLTTLHAACNTQKSDSIAANTTMGATSEWDGLLSHYPALVAASPNSLRANYHRTWMRHFGLPATR